MRPARVTVVEMGAAEFHIAAMKAVAKAMILATTSNHPDRNALSPDGRTVEEEVARAD